MRFVSQGAFLTFLVTFTIIVPSTVGAQEIASLEHDTSVASHNSLVQVDADTHALAYRGAGDDGLITTFTISAASSVPVTLMNFSVD